MNPEKIDLTAATISVEKLAQLRDLLPEVFHEGKIDFNELRNALGDYVEEDPCNERFGLRWPGRSRLQQVINTPSVGTLVPQPDESVDWDTTGNVIIEGDNPERSMRRIATLHVRLGALRTDPVTIPPTTY
jgi:adenine-specific DNA-methyltransferase